MRIRQIKPGFFKDARIASLPEPTQLFYIGLWMMADDAGWLQWDVPEIGAELYSFRPVAKRERAIRERAEQLVKLDRLQVYACGHAFVPKLTAHQHLAGTTKRVNTVERAHLKCPRTSPRKPADSRESPQVPALVRLGSVGKEERLGSVAPAGAKNDSNDHEGRRALQSVIDNPETPEHLRSAARLALSHEGAQA